MIHIHWFWLVVIIALAASVGMFVAALCAAAGKADNPHEDLPYPNALTADEALINFDHIANGGRKGRFKRYHQRLDAMREQIKKEGLHV